MNASIMIRRGVGERIDTRTLLLTCYEHTQAHQAYQQKHTQRQI